MRGNAAGIDHYTYHRLDPQACAPGSLAGELPNSGTPNKNATVVLSHLERLGDGHERS
jgi:hypothetical protein